MNILHNSYSKLNQAILADPVLCLAQAVAWLDPLWCTVDEELEFYDDPESILKEALIICRRVFPAIYIEVIIQLRSGQSIEQMDRFICEKISAEGIPIDYIEQMPWGIPLHVYGIDLEDEDTYSTHPELKDILDLLGVTFSNERYGLTISRPSYEMGEYLVESLEKETHPIYEDVAQALSWIFSLCRNTIVSATYEDICEMESLQWNEYDVEFAKHMIQEAEEIMCQAVIGLSIISEDVEIRKELKKNSRKVQQYIERKKKNDSVKAIRLKWSRA
ncbi:MAG: hypothetical protein Crog4KO_34730 [Crocinitomicaceae bacterium]